MPVCYPIRNSKVLLCDMFERLDNSTFNNNIQATQKAPFNQGAFSCGAGLSMGLGLGPGYKPVLGGHAFHECRQA